MTVLITGICGFVGSTLASWLVEHGGFDVFGVDNLSRPGSELNRSRLRELAVEFRHGDLRCPTDIEWVPPVDWVIDASALPSVLAGVDGRTSSRQIVEHNLISTVNLLELCRRCQCGFVLLSTSRVYSISALANLPMVVDNGAYVLDSRLDLPPGVSMSGIAEDFSTSPPVSLYGSTKLASETLAFEYGNAFSFPVIVNRCGILAGAGQFGRLDQGIVSFWVHSYFQRRPLRYLGFEGTGYQTRDCLHPHDLGALIVRQLRRPAVTNRPINVGGGLRNSFSLRMLSRWCEDHFGIHTVGVDAEGREYDTPWLVLDVSVASRLWGWYPEIGLDAILEEVAKHAQENPDWLDRSS